jgi:hypothetical protein
MGTPCGYPTSVASASLELMRPLVIQQALFQRHLVLMRPLHGYPTIVVSALPKLMRLLRGYPTGFVSASPELMRPLVVMKQALLLRHWN